MNDQDQFKFFVEPYDFETEYLFYGKTNNPDGSSRVIEKIMFSEIPVPPGSTMAGRDFMTLNVENAQALFDAMYRAGLRPSNYHGQNATEALKHHLEDMRKIAFKGLDLS